MDMTVGLNITGTVKTNTVKLTLWKGASDSPYAQHQMFKSKLPWETRIALKTRERKALRELPPPQPCELEVEQWPPSVRREGWIMAQRWIETGQLKIRDTSLIYFSCEAAGLHAVGPFCSI